MTSVTSCNEIIEEKRNFESHSATSSLVETNYQAVFCRNIWWHLRYTLRFFLKCMNEKNAYTDRLCTTQVLWATCMGEVVLTTLRWEQGPQLPWQRRVRSMLFTIKAEQSKEYVSLTKGVVNPIRPIVLCNLQRLWRCYLFVLLVHEANTPSFGFYKNGNALLTR